MLDGQHRLKGLHLTLRMHTHKRVEVSARRLMLIRNQYESMVSDIVSPITLLLSLERHYTSLNIFTYIYNLLTFAS